MLGALAIPRTIAGSTRWWSFWAQETCAASTPMGTEKPRGNHPSHTEKTMSATSPSQNDGMDESA